MPSYGTCDMTPLKLAAASSLAALVLTLGADRLSADHDGWSTSQPRLNRAEPRQDQQPQWWQQQPQGRSNRGYNDFTGWFQPQAELPQALPRARNIEPEAPPAKA